MAKKEDAAKFRIRNKATDEQIKKTRRRATLPKVSAKPVKRSPLIQFMIEHEKSGKTTAELYEEFRKDCGHDFREVATLVIGTNRTTYQVCNICGVFVKGKRGGTARRGKKDSTTEA
jgi:hypothetical protein